MDQIVVTREGTVQHATLSQIPVSEDQYIDLTNGQRRVIKHNDQFYFLVRTQIGCDTYKLEDGQLPFILRSGFGNIK